MAMHVVGERRKTTPVTCQWLSKALSPKMGFRHQGYNIFLPETAYSTYLQANLEATKDIKMFVLTLTELGFFLIIDLYKNRNLRM